MNGILNKNINFGSQLDVYKVVKKDPLTMPVLAVASSAVGAIGYTLGAAGLYYDTYKKSKGKLKNILFPDEADRKAGNKKESHSEGVKTIIPDSKFAKVGISSAKIGIAATTLAGMAAGIAEGIPMMTIGEMIGLTSSPIIETPIGTGLFGVGIASIFSGLALKSNPELLLNKKKLNAEESFSGKVKLIRDNVKLSLREVGNSCTGLIKNAFMLFTPQRRDAFAFFRENVFSINPKSIVFKELVNKDGKVFIEKSVKVPKNYLMHAASAVLTLGGLGVVLFSLTNSNKAQKGSLDVEEAGFFTDNISMTKYGIDHLSVAKNSIDSVGGTGFFAGGILNGISQIIGLDNKQGRAMQWLGIGLVFLGFGIERGKHLKDVLKDNKTRKEITNVLRQWEVDLTKLFNVSNHKENDLLKKTIKAVKLESVPPESNFTRIDKAFDSIAGKEYNPDRGKVKQYFRNVLNESLASKINVLKRDGKDLEIKEPEKIQEIIKDINIQHNKAFGEKPEKVIPET